MKKKMKNIGSETGSHDVGDEIEPVAGAARHQCGLYDLGQSAIGDADSDSDKNGFFAVSGSVGDKLLAITPQT